MIFEELPSTISFRIVDVCKIGCIPSEWVSRLARNNWALSWWLNGWQWHWLALLVAGMPRACQSACTSKSLCSSSENFEIPTTRLSIYVSCNLTLRFTWKAVDFFPPVYLSQMAKLKVAAFDGVAKQWVARFTTITAAMICCLSEASHGLLFSDLLTTPGAELLDFGVGFGIDEHETQNWVLKPSSRHYAP